MKGKVNMKTDWVKTARVFVAQVMQEGRRVVWPNRRDVVFSSLIVFILAILFSIFLFIADQVIITALKIILGMDHG